MKDYLMIAGMAVVVMVLVVLIGKKFNFTLSTPVKEISKSGLNAIMYGIDDTLKINLETAGISKTYKIKF